MNGVIVEKVVVNAEKGVRFHVASRGAVLLALSEERVVEFRHNNRVYRIDPMDVFEFVENHEKKELGE